MVKTAKMNQLNPVVKEPQIPTEGEYSLDQFGELVVYRDSQWHWC